jgi:hypothetical protein
VVVAGKKYAVSTGDLVHPLGSAHGIGDRTSDTGKEQKN